MQNVALRLVCLIAAASVGLQSHGQTRVKPTPDIIGTSLAKLRSDSFSARRRAQQRLLTHAKQNELQFQQVRARVSAIDADANDLELFLTRKRLLEQMDRFLHESKIDGFLHDPNFDGSLLTGWDRFSRHAGTDHAARSMFVSILDRHPRFGESLVRTGTAPEPPREPRSPSSQSCDFESIERDDTISWAMIMAQECNSDHPSDEDASLRLVASLRCFASGPMPVRERERTVVARLVDSYLGRCPADLRDRITIAARYRCRKRTASMCRDVLNDPTESPSRIVTALLAANAVEMQGEEVEGWIEQYRKDRRTSHVWRSTNPPKTTNRTQVKDVAFALHLHRQGIDPRERGFASLVADPILVFRAYSLGFETQEKREESHAGW